MGKRNNVKVSMEKLIELNRTYVRGMSEKPTMATGSWDSAYDMMGWDPGDPSRIHVNFGNSRGETYVLS